MKKKIFFHVGLPKTGTTILQEHVFPSSSFCYLGKPNISSHIMIDSGDPYLFIKSLMNIERPLKEYQYLPSIFDGKHADFCKYLFDRIKNSENILLSDEGFTLNPLRGNFLSVLKALGESSLPEDPFVAFRYGVKIAQNLFLGNSKFSNSLIPSLSISAKIKNILTVFNTLPGKILIVDRDYGSWFVSFYLQCFRGMDKLESLLLPQLSWGISSLMTMAGFFWRWEECMINKGYYGCITYAGFMRDLVSNFGSESICSAKYSSNRCEFANSLAPQLESFGLSTKLVLGKILRHEANVTCRTELRDKNIELILSSKEEIIKSINQSCTLFARRLTVELD